MGSARDRTVFVKTKQYLKDSKSLKVEIEELESLLGPDDTDVDFRRILEEARDEKCCVIFETFGTDGPSGQSFAMGHGPKEAERTMATKVVRFIKCKTEARGSGRGRELDGVRRKERS